MPFCSTCGKPLRPTDKFCPDDGTRVPVASSSPTTSTSTPNVGPLPTVAGGRGLSSNKGDDWITSGFKKSGYGGSEAETEAILGEMLHETNRVFGELGVSVSAQRRPPTQGQATPCGVCFKNITGSAVQACGKTMHAQCFTCFKCHDIIGSDSFVVRGVQKDQPWCDACITREKKAGIGQGGPSISPSQAGVAPFRPTQNATQTSSSSNPSSSPTGLTASQRSEFLSRRDEGKTFCRGCSQVMMDTGVVTSHGVYHDACFRCAKCNLVIPADSSFSERNGSAYHPACAPNSTGSGTNVCTGCGETLVGKFVRTSDQSPWHRECFVCSQCKKDLSAGYTLREKKPFCGPCASAATPYITKTIGTNGANKDMGGIRYNQVTREVTRVAAPNCVTSPVKNPGSTPSTTSAAAAPVGPSSSSSIVSGGNKFCQNCGRALAGMKFCGDCGTKA